MLTDQTYPARRKRASAEEMEARARFLIDYATDHAPVSVRQLFYAATVAGLIEKTENGYEKVQTQVLRLRREGRLPYSAISDVTRRVHKLAAFDGVAVALDFAAKTYRKDLWADTGLQVEVWVEKSALAGVLRPVTDELDVPLCPTGGFTSETFAHDAVERLQNSGKVLLVLALYDFDRAGQDAAQSLREKLERFGDEYGVPVIFNFLGLTVDQVIDLDLPTRPAKRKIVADQRWSHEFAAELDAIPPDDLRGMVRAAVEEYMPREERERLKMIEAAERAAIRDRLGGVP